MSHKLTTEQNITLHSIPNIKAIVREYFSRKCSSTCPILYNERWELTLELQQLPIKCRSLTHCRLPLKYESLPQ